MYFVIDAGPACATCFTNTRVHTRALNMNKADDACTLMHSRAHTCARTCTHAQPSCRAPMLDHARGPGVKRGCRDKGVGSDIKMDKAPQGCLIGYTDANCQGLPSHRPGSGRLHITKLIGASFAHLTYVQERPDPEFIRHTVNLEELRARPRNFR